MKKKTHANHVAARGIPSILGLSLLGTLCAGVVEGQVPTDASEASLTRDDKTQCGATLDFQEVESYDPSTSELSSAWVEQHQRPVGQIVWRSDLAARYANPGNVSGARWCSGTLIAEDLFLTAGHCFDQDINGSVFPRDGAGRAISSRAAAREMVVNFNFQYDPLGRIQKEDSYAITQLEEYRLGGLDFAVVRLAGSPGSRWGIATLGNTLPDRGDTLAIIGHPRSEPKKISIGTLLAISGISINYGDLDTLGGNSGSGILDAGGTVVGVHTNGGCTALGGSNRGVTIDAIRAQSPLVAARSQPGPNRTPTPDLDGCQLSMDGRSGLATWSCLLAALLLVRRRPWWGILAKQ